MDLTGKKVVVTGGEGFIGSHLVESLVGLGARVRVLRHYRGNPSGQNLQLAPQEVQDAVEMISGDVRDPYAVLELLRGQDVVFHLAALIGIPYSYEAPSSYVQTNVLGTLHVLEAARRHRLERVIHTSTSEVYGSAQYTPIDEQHPLVGQSPYSASKIGGDKLAESYHLSFDVPVITVRPFNTYGPRQSERAVIPTIAGQLIYGTGPIRLGDLTTRRDFTFVEDTARGFVLAAQCDAAVGRTVNLGSGKSVSIGELANILVEMTGDSRSVQSHQERVRPQASEVRELLADAGLAKKLLNWSPQVKLNEGLQRVVEFVRAHPQRCQIEGYVR